jgi:hypothetical protein
MSELLYKSDWEETQAHFSAWWAGESFERCAFAVRARRADFIVASPPVQPSDPHQRWTDLDFIAAENEYEHQSTFYGGEAFPIWHGGYPGHTSMPAYLGCPLGLDMNTGWWDPLLVADEWDVTALRFDPNNKWWQFTLEQIKRGIQEAAGKSIPDLGAALSGCGDILAALRGNHRLLLDVSLDPDHVREAEFFLLKIWIEVYDHLYNLTRVMAEGSTSWFRLWSPGRFYPTSCDFSYMISPKMFQRLFLPVIERWSQALDHTIYHVDGVEAFRHIPALSEIPTIQAFQVLPGAGKPSPLHYLDTLRLVQDRRKNLFITLPPDEVETALGLLSSRGLFIETSCETEAEARYLLKRVEQMSHP